MNIWIFNHYAVPPDAGLGTRHFDLARELLRSGHRVTIFAAGFNHATRREERLHRRKIVRRQTIDGVRFIWLRTTPYHDNSSRRAMNMLSYAVMASILQAGERRPDLVIGSSVHPFAALSGYLSAKLRHARFAFEVRDLWPETLIDMGAIRAHSISAVGLGALERLLCSRADLVITLLDKSIDYLVSRGAAADRLVYIPNGVTLKADPTRTGSAGSQLPWWRKRYSFVAAYTGSMGLANRLEVVIRAAEILRTRGRDDIGILLVGNGPDRAPLREFVSKHAVSTVHFLHPVQKADIPALLATVDAGLLHLTSSPVYRFGISPNKLFDYLAAALPVILSVNAEHPAIDYGAGLSIPPDDPESMANAIERLANLTEPERRAMGRAGLQYVRDHHDTRILARRLEEALETRA